MRVLPVTMRLPLPGMSQSLGVPASYARKKAKSIEAFLKRSKAPGTLKSTSYRCRTSCTVCPACCSSLTTAEPMRPPDPRTRTVRAFGSTWKTLSAKLRWMGEALPAGVRRVPLPSDAWRAAHACPSRLTLVAKSHASIFH